MSQAPKKLIKEVDLSSHLWCVLGSMIDTKVLVRTELR